MQLEVMEEFDTVERNIIVTVGGQKQKLPFSTRSFRKLFAEDKEIPIGFRISVRTSRQTRYTKLQHNELWLQMMGTLGNTVDPAIMIEGLEYEEKERLLDNIRRAQSGGMLNLQRQNLELVKTVEQQNEEIEQYKKAMAQAQSYIAQQGNTMQQATQGIRSNAYETVAEAALPLASQRAAAPDPTVMSEEM